MKRLLIVLPLVALALGLLLFLFRKSEPKLSARAPVAAPVAEARAEAPSKPSPSVPPEIPTESLGAIKFTVTANGQPLTGSKITVQRSGSDNFMVLSTEADGTLLVRGMPPVAYAILVEHPDYQRFTSEVRVKAGQTIPVPVDLKNGAKIFGTVRDKTGGPIPRTRVFLLSEQGHPMTSTAVYTNEQGYYQLTALPIGQFGIRFRHTDFKPADHPPVRITSPGDQYEVDQVLEVGARVSGKVSDEEGKPLEGALVVVSNEKSAGLQKTGADGLFAVGGLNDPPAAVITTRDGYGKVELRGVPTNGPDLDIRLPKAGQISGRIVVEEVPAQIQVILTKYDPALQRDVLYDSKFFPDPPKGAFTYPNVSPGTYTVDILVPGYVAIERPRLTVAAGQTTDGAVVTFRKKN